MQENEEQLVARCLRLLALYRDQHGDAALEDVLALLRAIDEQERLARRIAVRDALGREGSPTQ